MLILIRFITFDTFIFQWHNFTVLHIQGENL